MIKCNLAVILAERGIKITDLAEKTKLSRTTLTQLYYNQGKGIQFETLEKICDYLNITPGELLKYVDFKILIDEAIKNSETLFDFHCSFILNKLVMKGRVIIDLVNANEDGTNEYEKVLKMVIHKNTFFRISLVPEIHILNFFEKTVLSKNSQFEIVAREIAMHEDDSLKIDEEM